MRDVVEQLVNREYAFGFHSDIRHRPRPKGLNEDVVRLISAKKHEPSWLPSGVCRVRALPHPRRTAVAERVAPAIDYQDMHYWPPQAQGPALRASTRSTRNPGDVRQARHLLAEQERLRVAVDAIIDSVSVATTSRRRLAEAGVIFCSFSDAVAENPDHRSRLYRSVVPYRDNFFGDAQLAVFSDGSFAFVPAGVRCPELSTYSGSTPRRPGSSNAP